MYRHSSTAARAIHLELATHEMFRKQSGVVLYRLAEGLVFLLLLLLLLLLSLLRLLPSEEAAVCWPSSST